MIGVTTTTTTTSRTHEREIPTILMCLALIKQLHQPLSRTPKMRNQCLDYRRPTMVLSRNKNSNFHELTKMTAARIVDVLDQHQARRINVFTRRIDLSTNKKPLTDATRLIASVILLPKLLKPYYGGPMTKTTAHLLMMMVLQMSDKGGTLVSDRQPPTPVKERARETLNTPSRDTSEKKSARSAARTTNKPTPHAIPFCSMLF